MRVWGSDPYSPHQFASWLLMMTSVALVVIGVATLKRDGAPVQHATMGRSTNSRKRPSWYRTAFSATSATRCTPRCWHWPGAPISGSQPDRYGNRPARQHCPLADRDNRRKECLAYFGPAYAALHAAHQRFIPFLL